ncbi:fasciclin domain-containing protein [Chitinophaga sp. RAB17]|uniref:fasciclin domain-containing protein n=1 Tax=Chitinophaga sp. RAB17 TaxID=3233049 RepID=UPI003F8DF9C1
MRKLLPLAGILLLVGLFISACKKDYYIDGGLADPHYNGTIYDYLVKNPYLFDTVAFIVEKAGMKDMLQNDSVTFFAPTDQSIGDALRALNELRYRMVEDSAQLSDIPGSVWRDFLLRYIMKGKHTANQFARVDPANWYAYPGINYVMANGYILNIGLQYQNYNGVEAVGARILLLTDITFDPVTFRNNPYVNVASSDIQPTNGVIHALNIRHTFGFRGDFVRTAEQVLQNQ